MTATVMTVDAMRSRIQSFLAACNAHDVDAVLSHVTEDIIWEDPSRPGPVVGKDAVPDVGPMVVAQRLGAAVRQRIPA